MSFFSEVYGKGGGVLQYYADGEWRQSSSGRTVCNHNPCDGGQAYTMQGGCGGGRGV